MAKKSFRVQCNVCQSIFVLYVYSKDIADWQAGKHIQSAMPYLTPGERELLISGTCDNCFNEMFAVKNS